MRCMFTARWSLGAMVWAVLSTSICSHPCDSVRGDYNFWRSQWVTAQKDVVVVGGGVAGLQAVKTLIAEGVNNILLLEAQNYLGGRVKTHREGSILTEDGAEWIHGGWENYLYVLGGRLGALTQPRRDSDYEWKVKTQDGEDGDVRGYDAASVLMEECEDAYVQQSYYGYPYGQCYSERFDREYNKHQPRPWEKSSWRHYLHMWVNKDLGVDWQQVSMRDAAMFTDYGLDMWNQWTHGYDRLVRYLQETTRYSNRHEQVKLNSPVCKVFYNQRQDGRVLVVTKGGEVYLTDFVIFTPSIGYLKERHTQTFVPTLPAQYQRYINGMVLGVADKVQIGWNTPWWGNKPLSLQVLYTNDLPQEQYWMKGVMEVMSVHQEEGVLQVFVAGDHAEAMEALPEETVKYHLMDLLRRLTNMNIPFPDFFRRTQWGKNEYIYGSYNSYITMAGEAQGLWDRSALQTPVRGKHFDVLFWAGEHVNVTRYGTVDGAMASGEMAAYRVLDVMDYLDGIGR